MRLEAWLLPAVFIAGILGIGGLMLASGATPPTGAHTTYDRYWVQSAVPVREDGEPGWGGAIASWQAVEGGGGAVGAVRPASITTATSAFSLPLQAWTAVTDPFGVPRGEGRVHGGIDLGLLGYERSPVYAACSGPVIAAEYSDTYGYYAVVDCGGDWTTLAAHFSRLLVAAGDRVEGGASVLGISGSTGYSTGEHLHLEVRWRGIPIDPEEVLDFGG